MIFYYAGHGVRFRDDKAVSFVGVDSEFILSTKFSQGPGFNMIKKVMILGNKNFTL